ncbi:MAG: hypothetical protein Q6373_024435 [Candidatus Sigynarchaeota archaeon]
MSILAMGCHLAAAFAALDRSRYHGPLAYKCITAAAAGRQGLTRGGTDPGEHA